MSSLVMSVGLALELVVKLPFLSAIQEPKLYWGIAVLYAWTSLAVMTSGWVTDKPVAWHWPLIGGLTGIMCTVVFAPFLLTVLSCLFLGVYLSFLHLAGVVGARDGNS